MTVLAEVGSADSNGSIPPTEASVSCVQNAKQTATQHYDPQEIIESIRADKRFRLREVIQQVRATFASVMASTAGDRKAAKEAVRLSKARLPGVMWSRTFRSRKAPVPENLLEHSGLLCADLDELGERLPDIREKLLNSPHLWSLFTSPTGDGLKCVFRVSADAAKHGDSFRAVEQHVRELSGVQIDKSCSDLARLCFLSHDPDAHYNASAVELPLLEHRKTDLNESPPTGSMELEPRHRIAAELLGAIDWKTETRGFCTCPGKHLHTSGDGTRDCEVHVDGIATVYCFHDHCRGIVASTTHELRARLANTASPTVTQAPLPEIVDAERFLSEPLKTPAELVRGLIHQNTLTMFGGGSKSYKTFTVLDLALSVSQGVPWWGREVTQGRVLYLNFEIAPAFFQQRMSIMSDAKALERPLRDFDIWNLRGCATDIARLASQIIERCKEANYAMLIIDPIYKLMGNREENSNNEMAIMLNFFEQISEDVGGAAIVFCHHFTKGLASAKAQIDRVSGGGVFGRHPDGIITLTPHEEETAFVAEATLRNFAPIKPFVLRWEYPLMDFAPDLDPKKLRGKAGAKAKYTVDQVVGCLVNEMTTGRWEKAAYLELGLAHSTFARLKSQAAGERRVEQKGNGWFHTPKIHPFNPLTEERR